MWYFSPIPARRGRRVTMRDFVTGEKSVVERILLHGLTSLGVTEDHIQ